MTPPKKSFSLNSVPRPVLVGIMMLGMLGAFFSQHSLNNQRGRLSPTYLEPLQDAPPMLALTANALGGFRGIIATYLWLRANEMQLQDRYSEQMQLSEWVSQLQPTVPMVWVNRAWNMAYNISKTYEDPEIRWRYVYDGVKMLRDRGIKYNPQEPIIYNELCYIFEHKIAHNLDDHHRYFKLRWMEMMQDVLWESQEEANRMEGVPDFDALINPPNQEVAKRAERLRREFGMDPIEMKLLHERYGRAKRMDGTVVNVLDWRFAEVQTLYWGVLGRKRCANNPSRERELRKLEKKIYISMMYLFYRGKMNLPSGRSISPGDFVSNRFYVVPNLDIAESTHRSYLDMVEVAQATRLDHHTEGTTEIGHMNFLKRNISWLYFYNREEEALKWLEIAVELYPEKMTWGPEFDPETDTIDLEKLVRSRLEDDIQRGGDYQVQAILIGMLVKHFTYLALGDEDNAIEYYEFIERIYARYVERFKNSPERMGLPPLEDLRRTRLTAFLLEEDPKMVAQLRTRMGLGPDELPSPDAGNE